jgi:hypothetical protein
MSAARRLGYESAACWPPDDLTGHEARADWWEGYAEAAGERYAATMAECASRCVCGAPAEVRALNGNGFCWRHYRIVNGPAVAGRGVGL